MTSGRLRTLHQARPFRPFVIHMAHGKKIRITHPETPAYIPSGRSIFVALSDDSLHHIDLLMVVRFEVSDRAARRGRRRSA